jgi:hypothetical protein
MYFFFLTSGICISVQVRDEKIIELETENATLHLKVAKLMSHLQKANDKITFLNWRLADAVKMKSSWKSSMYSLYSNFLVSLVSWCPKIECK